MAIDFNEFLSRGLGSSCFRARRFGELMRHKSARCHHDHAQDQFTHLVGRDELVARQPKPKGKIRAAGDQAGGRGARQAELGGGGNHGKEEHPVVTAADSVALSDQQVAQDKLHAVREDRAPDGCQRELRFQNLEQTEREEERNGVGVLIGAKSGQGSKQSEPDDVLHADHAPESATGLHAAILSRDCDKIVRTLVFPCKTLHPPQRPRPCRPPWKRRAPRPPTTLSPPFFLNSSSSTTGPGRARPSKEKWCRLPPTRSSWTSAGNSTASCRSRNSACLPES